MSESILFSDFQLSLDILDGSLGYANSSGCQCCSPIVRNQERKRKRARISRGVRCDVWCVPSTACHAEPPSVGVGVGVGESVGAGLTGHQPPLGLPPALWGIMLGRPVGLGTLDVCGAELDNPNRLAIDSSSDDSV